MRIVYPSPCLTGQRSYTTQHANDCTKYRQHQACPAKGHHQRSGTTSVTECLAEAKTAEGSSPSVSLRLRHQRPVPGNGIIGSRDAAAKAERVAVTERITKQAAVPTRHVRGTDGTKRNGDGRRHCERLPPRGGRHGARKVASVAVEDSPERAVVGQWKALVAPYPKDWTAPTLNAREQSIVANAEALEANADWSGAAQVYQQAIPLSKSQVGQYFAAEATLRFLNAPSTSKAIKAANRCVALSAQNTAHFTLLLRTRRCLSGGG